MPKTKSPVQVAHEEYMADTMKWFDVSKRRPVQIIDEDGKVRMTLSAGFYSHTNRVEHQFKDHRFDPQMLSDLRNYYCDLNRKGYLRSSHALIEFIEAYADTQGWNLDDYSDIEAEDEEEI